MVKFSVVEVSITDERDSPFIIMPQLTGTVDPIVVVVETSVVEVVLEVPHLLGPWWQSRTPLLVGCQ